MRKDIGKVITEKPRAGGRGIGFPRHAKNEKIVEAWPFKEGMKKPYGYDTKDFTDVLGPVKGFLRKAVGRRWDSVYSEICQNLDKSKHTHQHVIGHIDSYVMKNAVFMDGEVKYLDERAWGMADKGYKPINTCYADFYVHPLTGILFKVPPRQTPQEKAKVKADNTKKILAHIRRINQVTWAILNTKSGIWFKYIAKIKPAPIKHGRIDGEGRLTYYMEYPYYNALPVPTLPKYITIEGFNERTHYFTEKKTLSHKEKKNLGII